jgi:hypothetical protein
MLDNRTPAVADHRAVDPWDTRRSGRCSVLSGKQRDTGAQGEAPRARAFEAPPDFGFEGADGGASGISGRAGTSPPSAGILERDRMKPAETNP